MKSKKGLGRGLSALIPDADMDFLSHIARGDSDLASVSDAVQDIADAQLKSANGKGNSAKASSVQRSLVDQDAVTPDPFISLPPGSALPQHDREVSGRRSSGDGVSAIEWLPISFIIPNPYQPRRHFGDGELEDLISSIKEHGVLQPILVRPFAGGQEAGTPYQIVAGERRWRAALAAGLAAVPAVIRAVADQQALELAIIENVQRHDISAIDTALAYRRLCTEFSLTQEDVARRVGKSRSAVANTMRLLDLPEEARKAIENGELSEGHGRAILLAAGEGARRALFKRILRDKLSVRESERLAQVAGSMGVATAQSKEIDAALMAEMKDLVFKLEKRLGTKININLHGQVGRISMAFTGADEFQRLCDLLLNS